MKNRSLICIVALILAYVVGIAPLAALADGFSFGGGISQTEENLKQVVNPQLEIQIFRPKDGEAVGSWSSRKGVAAEMFPGLPCEVIVTVSGIDTLKSMGLNLNDLLVDFGSKQADNSNLWFSMTPDNEGCQSRDTRRYIWKGNTNQIRWGWPELNVRVYHRDNLETTRVLIFKFRSLKDGSLQFSWPIHMKKEAPRAFEEMPREVLLTFLRGFDPAWPTTTDPKLVSQFYQEYDARQQAEAERKRQEQLSLSGLMSPNGVIQIPSYQTFPPAPSMTTSPLKGDVVIAGGPGQFEICAISLPSGATSRATVPVQGMSRSVTITSREPGTTSMKIIVRKGNERKEGMISPGQNYIELNF